MQCSLASKMNFARVLTKYPGMGDGFSRRSMVQYQYSSVDLLATLFYFSILHKLCLY